MCGRRSGRIRRQRHRRQYYSERQRSALHLALRTPRCLGKHSRSLRHGSVGVNYGEATCAVIYYSWYTRTEIHPLSDCLLYVVNGYPDIRPHYSYFVLFYVVNIRRRLSGGLA